MTEIVVATTGICRGCGTHKTLRSDGRIRDHLPPLGQREALDRTPCAGGGLPPEGERVREAAPPPVVKIPARRPAMRGNCRVCGRDVPLGPDGRARAHLDGLRMQCDGQGRKAKAAE